MTCSGCACFDVCSKINNVCKQLVFGNVGKVIHLRLLTAVTQGCSTYTPKKVKKATNTLQGQLPLIP